MRTRFRNLRAKASFAGEKSLYHALRASHCASARACLTIEIEPERGVEVERRAVVSGFLPRLLAKGRAGVVEVMGERIPDGRVAAARCGYLGRIPLPELTIGRAPGQQRIHEAGATGPERATSGVS